MQCRLKHVFNDNNKLLGKEFFVYCITLCTFNIDGESLRKPMKKTSLTA